MEKRLLSRSVAVAIAFVMVATTAFIPVLSNDGVYAAAKKTKLSKKKATVVIGTTLELQVKNTKKKVKWSSSKKKIATVNKKGVVKAKKAGKTTITAKVGKKKYKCKVTVPKPNGTMKNPFIAKDGVTILNDNGKENYTFKVVSTMKNQAAIDKLAALGLWDIKTTYNPTNTEDSDAYASYKGNYDFVLFEMNATNNIAAQEYVGTGDVFGSGAYTIGFEDIIKSKATYYYSNNVYGKYIKPGETGNYLVGKYIKKGNSYIMTSFAKYYYDAEGNDYPLGYTWVKYTY